MTLELAHQLALNKLVELLQTLTDPAEIRRVATAILRVKRPKNDAPPDANEQETPDAAEPQAPAAPNTPAPKPTTPTLSAANEPWDASKEHTRRVMMHCHTDRRAELATMTYAQLQHFINNRTVFVTGPDP